MPILNDIHCQTVRNTPESLPKKQEVEKLIVKEEGMTTLAVKTEDEKEMAEEELLLWKRNQEYN